VVIIDHALAAKYFPGEDPLGRKIEFPHAPGLPTVQVVGVIADVKAGDMDKETWPTVYGPSIGIR
jgi:macrolide transport system ATP-binding/permease protein